jgi:hypothetical protein
VRLGRLCVSLLPGVLGDPDRFFWSGFGDTRDQLMAQTTKGISILVERLYAGYSFGKRRSTSRQAGSSSS